jgi:hypothetical protein
MINERINIKNKPIVLIYIFSPQTMSNYYLKTQESIEDGEDLTEQLSIALNIVALNAISENDAKMAGYLRERVRNNTEINADAIIRVLYVSLHLTTTKSSMNMARFCEDREKLVDLLNWKNDVKN